MEIWSGVTDALLTLTHSLTNLKDSATQLLIKYKSGALTTQWLQKMPMLAIYLKKHREKSKLSIIKYSSMSSSLVVPQGDPSSGEGKYLWLSFESIDLFIKEKYSF